ncbi:hypothetical protein EVAR_100144_1 [Eumeta japonica]|uniref:Uncharacterized protein n=1 Tax=Eumeta variegata TaxID=151549 RepID=A0A4C1ZVW3_EUMVA|nr:hypothetical protein EVAR_100144_1 [Eumeta japonica]
MVFALRFAITQTVSSSLFKYFTCDGSGKDLFSVNTTSVNFDAKVLGEKYTLAMRNTKGRYDLVFFDVSSSSPRDGAPEVGVKKRE